MVYNNTNNKTCNFVERQTRTQSSLVRVCPRISSLKIRWIEGSVRRLQCIVPAKTSAKTRTSGTPTQRSNVGCVRSSRQNFHLKWKVKLYTLHMTREVTNEHPQGLPAHSTTFITFSYKSLTGFLFKLSQSSRRWKPEVALEFWTLCGVRRIT